MTTVRLDIWSDIACPWCYVGKRRLEAALEGFAYRDSIEIVWRAFELDPAARHAWWPIAPVARIEVEFDEPALKWSGEGYIDSNRGAEMLEAGFRHWSWSRAALKSGAAILYDVDSRHGVIEPLAIRFDRTGEAEPIELGRTVNVMPTRWLLPRAIRTDAGTDVSCDLQLPYRLQERVRQLRVNLVPAVPAQLVRLPEPSSAGETWWDERSLPLASRPASD